MPGFLIDNRYLNNSRSCETLIINVYQIYVSTYLFKKHLGKLYILIPDLRVFLGQNVIGQNFG